MFSYLRFRFQRWRRRMRRDLRVYISWSRNYINRHVLGKWRQLGLSRRFITIWWALGLIMLIGLWLQIDAIAKPFQPVASSKGMPYSEGGLGEVKIINPVLPGTSSENDITSLIFSGLVRYNTKGQLVPDLATSWEISPDGKSYTFHLRHGVKWQDGVPFTAQDVAFTLAAIQNPDSRSPLANSWQGVTIDTKGDDTVIYHLPNAYPPFLGSTVQGILPAHILDSTDPAALRASNFNQKPIGTGPYKLKQFLADQNEVILEAYGSYYGGKPQISEFDYHWYGSASEERSAYAKHQILGFGDVAPQDATATLKLPNVRLYSYAQPNEALLIMRNTQANLKNKAVRLAIALAVDRGAIIKEVLGNQATPVSSPILPGQLGYKGQYQLPKYNFAKANQTLDEAGWTMEQGVRKSGDQTLKFTLVTRDSMVDKEVANAIKAQLAKIGIQVDVKAVDLNSLQQSYIRPRNYDLLLFGYNIGADPDVYAFWDSSQASDPGLNLAAYNNPVADRALESGRVSLNNQIRAGKYQTFQQAWQADAPSVPLYSQNYLYAVSGRVIGPDDGRLIEPTDRFFDVQKWLIVNRPVH